MVEAAVAHAGERARAKLDPLHGDIDTLGQLIKQIAESVAAHETVLASAAVPQPEGTIVAAESERESNAADDDEPLEPAAPSTPAVSEHNPQVMPPRPVADAATAPAERLDLYLQPIVMLPQRKVRYYEILPRLRGADEAPFAALEPRAPDEELPPALDLLTLQRSLQIVRRLSGKNREVAVFSRLSGTTLGDATHWAQTLDLLAAHGAFAPSVFLGVAQRTLRRLGPIEQEALAQIVALGFRLSLEGADDLRLEPRQLAAQGVRFAKVPATALLSRQAAPATDIHPSDLARLLGRYGIDLIAADVQTEGMVVDLLDCDVGLAQGPLFSAPRPVRPEVFEVKDPASPNAHAAGVLAAENAEPAPSTRRRQADPPAPPRTAGERSAPGIAKLARNIMRRT